MEKRRHNNSCCPNGTRTIQQHLVHHNWHHLISVWLTFWISFICMLNPALPEAIYRVDPLALLAATLRTYQRAGCDSEQLALSCPRGTSISIELAQYGRAGDLTDHSLCPPVSQEDLTTTNSADANSIIGNAGIGGAAAGGSSSGVIHSSTQIEVNPPETCTVSGLQYALLQTVVDACQKKRHCKFSANSKPLVSGDPCAGIRKFVEIAYKCRPYEFRSKVACENDNMPLVCNPYSRIAIYSASFGHIERESVQCPHNNTQNTQETPGSKQTCLVSYATETVMQICHGRRRCSVTADAGTFGKPCKNDVPMHLKVVYTCIPRKVLKDRYETAAEPDEPQQSELDLDQDELYDEDQFYKEGEAIPPAPKLQGAIPNAAYPFDFHNTMHSNDKTTTQMPSILSRNDNSLEGANAEDGNDNVDDDDLYGGSDDDNNAFYDFNIKNYFKLTFETTTTLSYYKMQPSPTEMSFSSSVASILDEENSTTTKDDNNSSATVPQNIIYVKRCQMEDDWGAIGLNCTDDDIIVEQVIVIGFLINWINAYIHIRKNQEQFYLYLIISVAAGMLLCLTLVIGRLTLQRRRASSCRKNSLSSGSNTEKNTSDKVTAGVGVPGESNKYQLDTTRQTQLNSSFGDDISEIDADIDLTSPMPLPSLPSRNESYMTYAPIPNCNYGSLGDQTTANYGGTTTTMLMPSTSQHNSLMMPSGLGVGVGMGNSNNSSNINSGKPLGCPTVVGSRQTTPPPSHLPGSIYTSMGICSPSVSGTMTMGPNVFTSQHQPMGPSYLSGTIMVPGHHHSHTGTLRRNMVPTSMGIINTPSPPPPTLMGAGVNSNAISGAMPHSIMGVPTSSSVYYDSTIPRHFSRGMSADSTQYFYG